MYVCVCCFFFSVHGTCTANNTRVNIHCHTAVAKPHFLFSFIYTIFFIPGFVLLTVISRMIRIHRTPNMKKKNQIYLLRTMCSPCPEYKRAHTHTQNIIIKRYSSETDFDGLAVRTAHTPPYFSIACMRLCDQFRHSAKSLFFFILLLFHRMNGNVHSD